MDIEGNKNQSEGEQKISQSDFNTSEKANSPTIYPPLVGIGGWLILPMISILVSLFSIPLSAFFNFKNAFEYWDILTNPTSSAYIPALKELIYFELLANLVFYIILISLCYLFFTKKYLTIRIFIIFQVFSFFLVTIDIYLADVFLNLRVESSDVVSIVREFLVSLIWISYFLKSQRVKNTFIN